MGDGGFVIALEKRGYVKGGPFTPEATVENPDAGKFGRPLILSPSDTLHHSLPLSPLIYYESFERPLLPVSILSCLLSTVTFSIVLQSHRP